MPRVRPEKVIAKCMKASATFADRLTKTVAEAQKLLENNNLNDAEVVFYKSSVKAANKMITALSKVAETEDIGKAPARKRGRPPKLHTEGTAAPKKRGRPAKAAVVEAATPKRRGRPPKAAVQAAEAPAAPKRRGRPPKVQPDVVVDAAPKKRGRPKGSKNKPKELEATV